MTNVHTITVPARTVRTGDTLVTLLGAFEVTGTRFHGADAVLVTLSDGKTFRYGDEQPVEIFARVV